MSRKVVEQPNPGDPNSGLRTSISIKDTVRAGPSGLQGSRTVQLRDADGSFERVEVDTTISDKVLTVNLQGTPSENPN
jgi:hypothetical protein